MEIKISHVSPAEGVSDLIVRKVSVYTGVHGTTPFSVLFTIKNGCKDHLPADTSPPK